MHQTPIGSGIAGLCRVTIRLDPVAWHQGMGETLWAEPLAPGKFRLQNIPAYAAGFSFKDIVCAKKEGMQYIVKRLCLRGGHSTYWLSIDESCGTDDFGHHWSHLARLGCRRESDRNRFYAVDVPPRASIAAVHRALLDAQLSGVWRFVEGHRGHGLAEDLPPG